MQLYLTVYASFSRAVVPEQVQWLCCIVLCPLYESCAAACLTASTPDRKFKLSWPPQIYQETSDHDFITLTCNHILIATDWYFLFQRICSCYTFCWNCMGLGHVLTPPPLLHLPEEEKWICLKSFHGGDPFHHGKAIDMHRKVTIYLTCNRA